MPSTPINIAGIVLDRAGFQPLAGAEIRETKSRQRLFTDAKGFYSLQLSAASDKPAFQLKLYWQGKLVTSHGVSLPESYGPQGWIQIDIVDIQTGELADAMLHSPEFPNSPNPGYDIESTPNRRSEFEARFGPLPDYIPVAVRQGTDSHAVVFPERNVGAGESRQMMHVQHISIIDIESDHTK